MEKGFNLLDKPWIRVMLPDCTIKEISLTEALMQAHTFSSLAGEMPTQDMAVLRLLLAVLHTVFSRVDETGAPHPIRDEEDALDRWESLWKAGRFPEEPIREYLRTWRERFYLFHPEWPFYQVKEAANGTEYTAAKLNGTISESSNKIRIFSLRAGAEKTKLSFSEAARWLLYVNGYDDTSAKPKQKGLPSPGVGWLGKLGLIAARGENLFETLLLNLVLLNEKGECWGKNVPVWELEKARTQERCEIAMPDNQAQLLTLQSRRLLLLQKDNQVVGYQLLGGDFFDKANAFSEQMTLWTYVAGKGNQPSYVQPKRHDASKKIWREFSSIFVETNETFLPGVVLWQRRLKNEGLLGERSMARFQVAGVQYGDKDFFVMDTFSDELRFHLSLLTNSGKVWRERILQELATIDAVAREVMYLGSNIERAVGGAGNVWGKQLKEQFYDRIDIPFRKFLISVDAKDDIGKQEERQEAWHEQERQIAGRLAKEAASQAGPDAFVGRTITEKKEKWHYSLPEALNAFYRSMGKLLKSTGKE